jgi:tRNA A58 N-methylase Trm61
MGTNPARHAVLDLGTGTGDLAEILAETVGEEGRVLGLDLSDGMLSVARTKLAARGFRHATVRKGNARGPPNRQAPTTRLQRWGGYSATSAIGPRPMPKCVAC